MPKLLGFRERLNWHHRVSFNLHEKDNMACGIVRGVHGWTQILVVEAHAEKHISDSATLKLDVMRTPILSIPLSAVCVFDSVLEARVANVERIIEAMIDADVAVAAQIAAVFGAKRDHVDHRVLPVSGAFPIDADCIVRLMFDEPVTAAAKVSVDLYGIATIEAK